MDPEYEIAAFGVQMASPGLPPGEMPGTPFEIVVMAFILHVWAGRGYRLEVQEASKVGQFEAVPLVLLAVAGLWWGKDWELRVIEEEDEPTYPELSDELRMLFRFAPSEYLLRLMNECGRELVKRGVIGG